MDFLSNRNNFVSEEADNRHYWKLKENMGVMTQLWAFFFSYSVNDER